MNFDSFAFKLDEWVPTGRGRFETAPVPVGGALEIKPASAENYGLDYPRIKVQPDLGVAIVTFAGEHIPETKELFPAWYVRLQVQKPTQKAPRDVWLTLQLADELRRLSDAEYAVPFLRTKMPQGLHLDEINVRHAFNESFGKEGFQLLGVTGFRVRGHVKISRIEIIRDDMPPGEAFLPVSTISFGDTVRLRHRDTHAYLSSLAGVNYSHAKGSGGPMVVGQRESGSDTLWLVCGPNKSSDEHRSGEPVHHGETIRLRHVATDKYLHSHHHPVPLTGSGGQHEVVAWGENGYSDINDDWKLYTEDAGPWYSRRPIRLLHAPTEYFLHSHGDRFDVTLTHREQEVTCFKKPGDANDFWISDKVVATLAPSQIARAELHGPSRWSDMDKLTWADLRQFTAQDVLALKTSLSERRKSEGSNTRPPRKRKESKVFVQMEDALLLWIRAQANRKGNENLAVRIEGWALQRKLPTETALLVADELIEAKLVRRESIPSDDKHYRYGLAPKGVERLDDLDIWWKQVGRWSENWWVRLGGIAAALTVLFGLIIGYGSALDVLPKVGLKNPFVQSVPNAPAPIGAATKPASTQSGNSKGPGVITGRP
jgi:hypothetical protein